MLKFEHFCKCTPEMYPRPLQISKYATVQKHRKKFLYTSISHYQIAND